MPLCLTIVEKNGRTYSRCFQRDRVTIGRSPTCDLQLDPAVYTNVSRFHGRVIREDDGNHYFYEDLISMHGSYYKGRELSSKLALKRGDTIALGRDGPEIHITWEEKRITGQEGTHIRRYQKDSPNFPLAFSTEFLNSCESYEKIASGGFGEVWRGTRLDGAGSVAIKLLNPLFLDPKVFDLTDRQSLIRRFAREAHLMHVLGETGTQGLLHIHGWGDDPERDYLYIIMDYVEAQSLDRAIFRETMNSPRKVVALMLQVARILAMIHNYDFLDIDGKPCHGVVHRDIKPNNILIDLNEEKVWLIDFGIAGIVRGGDRLTSISITVGTLQFLPIEAVDNQVISPTTDLWAFTVTMYLVFSRGRFPYQGKSRSELSNALKAGRFQPIESHRQDLPPPLVEAINASLSANVHDRVPTAHEWVEILSNLYSSNFPGEIPRTP